MQLLLKHSLEDSLIRHQHQLRVGINGLINHANLRVIIVAKAQFLLEMRGEVIPEIGSPHRVTQLRVSNSIPIERATLNLVLLKDGMTMGMATLEEHVSLVVS